MTEREMDYDGLADLSQAAAGSGPTASATADANAGEEVAGLIVTCGDRSFAVAKGTAFSIGRAGDLAFPDNQYLHRYFLTIHYEHGFWWLVNVADRIAPTVSDARTGTQSWLAPGARLPLIFAETMVVFTAGPETYQVSISCDEPVWQESLTSLTASGDTTVGSITFTKSQRQLIVALAEPSLRRENNGVSRIPSSAEAAARLGWTLTRFNRKLDNVCDKLDRFGVDGLRGQSGDHATNRRNRLVEYSVATGLVQPHDLRLLEPDQLDPSPEEEPERPAPARGEADGQRRSGGPVMPVLAQRFAARQAAEEALRQARARRVAELNRGGGLR
ncbi:MAG: hypothetical protein LBD90_09665 [Bifidobacteriaceae bacterium]|jgi:hypothetical protein|nr:hypothetical protein [Bifidobacteriaceae bacterium]